jgi:hypothetical protein
MATINVHNQGDLVRLTGSLATAAGVVVDPTTLTVTIKAPNGTKTEYTYGDDAYPVRSAAGVYYVEVTPDQVGDWYYKFQSSGTGQAADEGMFRVRASAI